MSTVLIVGRDDHTAEFAASLQGADVVRCDVASLAALDADAVETVVDLTLGTADDHAAVAARLRGIPSIRRAAVSALSITATESARAWDPVPVASIGWLPGLSPGAASLELAAALQLESSMAETLASDFAALLGRPVELLADRVGLVSARILAMLVNEAAFAVMEGVASPVDIDTAMRLGTNYPAGPLTWADTVGAESIVHLLDALAREYGEERYRACVLLRQHARAGLPFHSAVAAH